MLRVQIGNEPGLNRSPSQPFLCLRTGSWAIHTKEGSDPAEVFGCFLTRLADDGYVQVSADDIGDFRAGTPSSATP